jgi:hypothetical protein
MSHESHLEFTEALVASSFGSPAFAGSLFRSFEPASPLRNLLRRAPVAKPQSADGGRSNGREPDSQVPH